MSELERLMKAARDATDIIRASDKSIIEMLQNGKLTAKEVDAYFACRVLVPNRD